MRYKRKGYNINAIKQSAYIVFDTIIVDDFSFLFNCTRYLACNDKKAFFTSTDHRGYKLWSCQNVCNALSFLLENIYFRFGYKLYRQIVGIPMGTNCAPLVADLFLFCYERDFMTSLSDGNQADITEAFNSTSRYLDNHLNIDNPYFEGMVNQIYPPELQLNKANTSDTEAPCWIYIYLFLTVLFPAKFMINAIYNFDFDIVNFPFFGWRCSTSSLLWSDYFSTY